MKRAIKLLLFVGLLLGLWAAHYFYLSAPLSLTYGDYSIAPPLSLALLLLAAALLAVYIAAKALGFVMFLPRRLRKRLAATREAKRYESLLRGLRALVAGDSAAQEKHFARAAADGLSPQIAALLAAAGARAGGRAEKNEQFLRRAIAGDDAELKAAARAELALSQGRPDEAAAILREAGALKSATPLLADLLRRSCAADGDSAGALAAVNRLRDLRPGDDGKEKALAKEAAGLIRARIAAIANPGELRDFWESQVAPRDREGGGGAKLAAVYALRLDALGDAGGAAAIIAKAIKKERPSADFFAAAARIGDDKIAAEALKRAEALIAADTKAELVTAATLRAAGELAARFALWGKAREFLEMANSRAPDARTYFALAALFQKTGKNEEAGAMLRRAREVGEEKKDRESDKK
jgi:HemY protein